MKNILSFDIEEHFQVSGMADAVKRENWDKHDSRVVESTGSILELLGRYDIKATFFILGWIAKRHPKLVELIAENGHEIASHGFDHKLIYDMPDEQLREELAETSELLESLSGQKIIGHRAPSFSLGVGDIDKFKILSGLGFKYDSSLFPMKHFRYADSQSAPLAPFEIKANGEVLLKEFPMTVVEYFGKRIPAAGGGYFRLFPDFLIDMNIKKAMAEKRPVIVYLHPWEFDPKQPRLSGAGLGNTFRHYINLDKTYSKLEKIISKYEFTSFRDVL